MRLPGTGRDQARVVERIDHLRPLAGLVVDLLVRTRSEERCERVRDGQQAVPREAGGGRDHVLLGDPALDEPLRVRELEGPHAAVRGEVRVEDDEILPLGTEADELLAVRVDDVLVRDSGPAGPRARLGLALERLGARLGLGGERLEPKRTEAVRTETLLEPFRDLGERTRERLVVGRSGVPAVRPTTRAQRLGVLHEGDALALDRAGDERLRAVPDVAECRERRA